MKLVSKYKTKRISKRLLSVLLSGALFLTSVDVQAFADEMDASKSFFYAGNYYDTIYDALEVARDDGNKNIDISVKGDIEITKGISVLKDENITISVLQDENIEEEVKHNLVISDDFNTKTDCASSVIDGISKKANLFLVNKDASLTIDGFELDGHISTSNENSSLISRNVIFYSEGSLSFINGKISGWNISENMMGINGGSIDFTGSEISEIKCKSTRYSVIKTDGESFISGGTFKNIRFSCNDGQGGFIDSRGTLILENLKSTGGYVHTGGYIKAERLYMNNCNLSGVEMMRGYGLINLVGNKTSKIYNSDISGAFQNTSNSNGIASDVGVNGGQLFFYGVNLEGNKNYKTHGVSVNAGKVVFKKAGEYEDKYFGKITTKKSVISKCYQGIVVDSEGTVKAEELDITSNKADYGAGIVNKGTVELLDVSFKDNIAIKYTDNKVLNKVKCGDDIYDDGILILHGDVHFENEDNLHILLTEGKHVSVCEKLKFHNYNSINLGFEFDSLKEDIAFVNYSGEEGLCFDAVRDGVWTVKSISAAENKNMVCDGDYIKISGYYGSLVINVKDNEGKKVSGTIFELHKKADDGTYKVMTITDSSDDEGKIKIDKLLLGDYKLKCIYIPEGYNKKNVQVKDFHMEDGMGLEINVGRYNEAPKPVITFDKDEKNINAYEEVTFSGKESTDDTGIKKYSWDFGDGVTDKGAEVKHEFTMEGLYIVTLVVEDQDGRKESCYKEIYVTGDGLLKITVNVKSTESGNYIPNSYVYVTDDGGKRIYERTSKTGKYEFITKPDTKVNITATARGYFSRSTKVLCKKSGTVNLYLSTKNTVEGEVKTKTLSIDEMREAGIDVEDLSNRHIVKYELKLSFTPIRESFSFLVDETEGKILDNDWDRKDSNGDVSIQPRIGENKHIYLLIVRGTNSWLKDMFEVELLLINNSRIEQVKDAEAKILLPEGLSLAKMREGDNEITQKLPDIDTLSCASALWYVRGDEDGSYKIDVEVNGKMHVKENADNKDDDDNEENEIKTDDYNFSYLFESEEPVNVVMQSALGVLIDVEQTAATGDTYTIKFNYYNKSPKSIYGLYFYIDEEIQLSPGNETHNKGTLTVGKVVGENDDIKNAVLTVDDNVKGNYVKELKPGEFVRATYETEITFLDEHGDEVITRLVALALSILEGSTASMDVQFTSHMAYKDYRNFEDAARKNSIDVFGGDPVNLLTGAFEAEFNDMHIKGYRDLDFNRYYNSKIDNEDDTYINGFGKGWSHSYDYRITNFSVADMPKATEGVTYGVIDDDYISDKNKHKSIVRISCPGGKTYTLKNVSDGLCNPKYTEKGALEFDSLDAGDYSSVEGVKLKVIKSDGKITRLEMMDKGVVYTFDSKKRLVSIKDVEGFETKLSYDGMFLKTISNDVGSISLSWNLVANVISGISFEKNGESISVTYGYENNLITSEINPNGYVSNYTYVKVEPVNKSGDDSDEKVPVLKTISDYEGKVVIKNSYDRNRRVTIQETGGKGTYTYDYDDEECINTQTGFNGHKREIKYNKNFQVIRDLERVNGVVKNKTTYEYNAFELPSIIEDKNGIKIIEYNECNDISYIRYPDASFEGYEYDTDDTYLLLKSIDREGAETSFEYKDGLLVEKRDGNKNQTTYTYDKHNRLHTEERNGNVYQKITYNEDGRIKSIEDGDGYQTSFNYDAFGNVCESINDKGESICFSYDKCGNLKEESDEFNKRIKYELDKNGNVIKTTDRRNNSEKTYLNINGDTTKYVDRLSYETKYVYDDFGNLSEIEYPDKARVSFGYDSYGNVKSKTDEYGKTWTYEYDKLNRLDTISGPLNHKEYYSYDSDGNVIMKTYDNSKGKLLHEYFEYDSNGRLIREVDREGNEKTYDYDSNGNLKIVIDEDNVSTFNEYDENNNLVKSKIGDKVTNYEYDLRGNVKRVTVTKDDSTGESHEKKYKYDFRGNVTSCIDELSNETTYEYDKVGNLIKTTYCDDTCIQYTYDENGNIKSVTDRKNNTISYEYDEEDRLAEEIYGKDRKISYIYDYAGRVLSKTYPEGKTENFTYDKAGNLTTYKTNKNITVYERDALGRVVSETVKNVKDEDEKVKKISYEYDVFDNVIKVTDSYGNSVSYDYDGNGRVKVKKDSADNETYYEYDGRGNVLREKYNTGKVVSYKYNYDNLVIEKNISYDGTLIKKNNRNSEGDSNDSDGDVPDGIDEEITYYYDYDLYGNLTKYTDGLGNETTYEYDALGNRVKISDALGNYTEFTYDAFGNVVNKKSSGRIDESFKYDGNNNLEMMSDSNGNIVRFTYDEFNNLKTKVEVAASSDESRKADYKPTADDRVTSYEYDNLNRCIKETYPDGSFNEYTYDHLEKIKSIKDAKSNETSYDYDYRGNLISVKRPEGDVTSYVYDGNDNLTEIHKAKGGIISYTYDACGNLNTEKDEAGSLKKYTYDCFGNVLSENNSNGIIQYDYNLNDHIIRKQVNTKKTKEEYRYAYDKNDNLTGLSTYMNDKLKNYTSISYDKCNNVKTVCDDKGAVFYSYDNDNRKSSISYQNGDKVSYEFDNNGNITSIKSPSKTYGYNYNSFNEVILKSSGNITHAYDYDKLGRVINLWENGYVLENYSYDKVGNLSTKALSIVNNKTSLDYGTYYAEASKYTYDKNGRLVSQTDRVKSSSTYKNFEYDNDDNLIRESTSGKEIDYTYENGRLKKRTEYTKEKINGSVVSTVSGKTSYDYDVLGNLVNEEGPDYDKTFKYDAESNLISSSTNVSIETDKGSKIASLTEKNTNTYVYNALGLLCKKINTKSSHVFDGGLKKTSYKNVIDRDYSKVENYFYDLTDENPTLLSQNISVSYDDKYVNTFESGLNDDGTVSGRYLKQDKETDTYKNYNIENSYIYRGDEKAALKVDVNSDVTIEKIQTTIRELGGIGNPSSNSVEKSDTCSDEYYLLTETDGSVKKAYNTDSELVADIKYGSYGNITSFKVADKYVAKDDDTDDAYSSKTILTEELKSSDILPSYTSYIYSDELRSLQDERFTSYMPSGRDYTDDGLTSEYNKNTTWYAFERFYSTITKRFTSKDPVVGSIYEPERVNSYIYAGNNPLVYMDRDGRSFTCKIVNSRIFKKAVDVYETFKTVVDKVGSVVKPVVETVVKAYNDFNKFIDETPTCVKIVAGAVGGILAAASGVSPIAVGVTLISSAVSGAAINAAMYGLESISTGEFNKTDLINSMLDGALDMFYICGVVMGSKAVVDGIVRNAGRIQDALLANEETGITFSDEFVNSVNEKYSRFTNRLYSNEEGCSNIHIKIDEFIENINGKIETSYGKSSENVVKGGNDSVPKSLLKGKANTRVYYGIKDGKKDYVGITNNISRRQAQHGDRFDRLIEITDEPLTRRQARAIEQVLIGDNQQFSNKINSISSKRDWYNDATEWARKWLSEHDH